MDSNLIPLVDDKDTDQFLANTLFGSEFRTDSAREKKSQSQIKM